MERDRVGLRGRFWGKGKIFGCRNKNKTKVGFDLVTGAFLLITGGVVGLIGI